MAKKFRTKNRSSSRQTYENASDVELQKKLQKTLAYIGIITVLLIIAGYYFAPNIASIFGFISVHRNDTNEIDVAPGSPILTNLPVATQKEKIIVEGYSEPGTKVKLFVNGPEVAETITDAEGKFTFADVSLIKGTNTIYAKALNEKGTASENSFIINIAWDDKAPEIEIISPKEDETVRNLNKRITVIGKVNEKAQVTVNGSVAVLKPDLTFEIILGVKEGSVEIKIEAEDEAGNKSEKEYVAKYVNGS